MAWMRAAGAVSAGRQGGTPQNPLTPGTLLQQGSVIVPGLQSDLPFDVCLVGLQITP